MNGINKHPLQNKNQPKNLVDLLRSSTSVSTDSTNQECNEEEDKIINNHAANVNNKYKPVSQMSENALYDLLFDNGCFIYQDQKEKIPFEQWTHVIMSGRPASGLLIPSSKEKEFLLLYAQEVNQSIFYFIEKRTPFFKFNVDFDIKRKTVISDEALITLTADLVNSIKRFYPKHVPISRFDAVICKSTKLGKTGMHVIFPNLIVNTNQAIDIRNYYVSFLVAKFGDMVGIQNSWEDVVDISIYKTNGLRMVGSYKSENCPNANCPVAKKMKDKIRCDICKNQGKVHNQRRYMPSYYLRDGQVQQEWHTIFKKESLASVLNIDGEEKMIIELCSIRCPGVNAPSSEFGIYDGETLNMSQRQNGKVNPINTNINTNSNTNNNINSNTIDFSESKSPRAPEYTTLKTDHGSFPVSKEDHEGMAKWKQKKHLSPQGEPFKLIQDFINGKNIPTYWNKLVVYNVFTNPKGSHYVINVRGEGQRYCLNNRNGNHKSNSIYFFIQKGVVVQRCYCTCQTTENRKNGLCKEFSSKEIPLPFHLNQLLFPETSKYSISNERQVSMKSGLDEYTFSVLNMITKLDESQQAYIEERNQRLNKKHQQQETFSQDQQKIVMESKGKIRHKKSQSKKFVPYKKT